MSSELTNLEKIRRLPWQIAGNSLNNFFAVLTFFGSVFVLFLNELNLDKTQIGFILSLIPFSGLIALFAAPKIARFGLKKSFLLFFGLRKISGGLLLITPLILTRTGPEITFAWVAGIVAFFAICRALSETAFFPWQQEIVPNNIRGKFGATNNIMSMVFSIFAMMIASVVISRYTGLGKFQIVIAVGTLAGVFSVWCFSFLPGGLPVRETESAFGNFKAMFRSLEDRNFKIFLIGLALVTLGATPLFSFIPLFMKEQIGLRAERVVLLDIGILSGALVSCYLWGWASDRYGSKPVMLCGPLLLALLPIGWFLVPRDSSWSLTVGLAIAFVAGAGNMGWIIGFGRYLFVSAVPVQQKTAYMAVFYAWVGLMGGVGPLLAGRLLDYFQPLRGQFLFFHLDAFTPLFAICFFLLLMGMITLNAVRSDGAMPVRKFIGMFVQGNPLMALESLARYGRARNEVDRVWLTERMGDAKNRLSSNELIESLDDPSFSVRYEAIISISRLPPDPELVDALVLVLGGNEPDLSIAAAWALGKLRDKSAIVPLRETLLSEFQLLQVHSARALGKLGDTDSIPFFIEKLRADPSDELRLAYASALGALGATQATKDMLDFLRPMKDRMLRNELSLAIARIVGPERTFIQLWRVTRNELGTPIAQTLLDLTRTLADRKILAKEDLAIAEECTLKFSRDELIPAVALFSVLLRKIPSEKIAYPFDLVLQECAEALTDQGLHRSEYLLLAIHTLYQALRKP